jgi:hypothetical protein
MEMVAFRTGFAIRTTKSQREVAWSDLVLSSFLSLEVKKKGLEVEVSDVSRTLITQ